MKLFVRIDDAFSFMSFEALRMRLLGRDGRQVTEPVQSIVCRAFERAAMVPDANIDHLVLGASRVARVLSEGKAAKPDEYASSVLGRIASSSQREFTSNWHLTSLSSRDAESLLATEGSPSEIIADIEISQLLAEIDPRDREILIRRDRGFTYKQIADEFQMLEVTVRCRHHLAKGRLRKLSTRKG